MSNMKNRYTKEFKVEAVELAKKIGTAKASEELGVTRKSIQNWIKGKGSGNSTNSTASNISDLETEVRRLKKENRNLKIINEVLKKSTAIFSKDQIGD